MLLELDCRNFRSHFGGRRIAEKLSQARNGADVRFSALITIKVRVAKNSSTDLQQKLSSLAASFYIVLNCSEILSDVGMFVYNCPCKMRLIRISDITRQNLLNSEVSKQLFNMDSVTVTADEFSSQRALEAKALMLQSGCPVHF